MKGLDYEKEEFKNFYSYWSSSQMILKEFQKQEQKFYILWDLKHIRSNVFNLSYLLCFDTDDYFRKLVFKTRNQF